MSDLRRRALGGGKTVSRKARSKAESGLSSASHSPNGSPANSRPSSRPSSRPGSRYASEDEYASDSDNDDVMTIDTGSVSGDEDATNTWADRLQDRVTELQDRKRSSVQGREATLGGYNHLLKHHVALRQLERSAADVMSILLKDIKNGSSEEERLRAIKAFTLSVLTCPSDSLFDQALPVLKAACNDTEADEEAIKVEAIRALSVAVTYGGGSSHAAEEVLDFLLEIVESDGHSVNAADSGPVVTAALQAWAFVASHMEDLTVQFEAAIEAFVEQLDSSDPEVQTSAGVNIALLFETARDYEEETGQGFDLQYNQHRIITRMSEIVRDTSKAVSKKQRRNLRSNFSSIVTSLERGKGPGYSTAGRSGPNPHTGVSTSDWGEFREFGYREKIRVYNQFLLIDTWSLHARVEVLKTLLGGGFGIHYLENPVVRDILSGVGIEYLGAKKTRK